MEEFTCPAVYVIRMKIYPRDVFENQAKLGFPNNQTKFLKNNKNGVLFLFKTHPKHRKHILITKPTLFAQTITSEEHKSI